MNWACKPCHQKPCCRRWHGIVHVDQDSHGLWGRLCHCVSVLNPALVELQTPWPPSGSSTWLRSSHTSKTRVSSEPSAQLLASLPSSCYSHERLPVSPITCSRPLSTQNPRSATLLAHSGLRSCATTASLRGATRVFRLITALAELSAELAFRTAECRCGAPRIRLRTSARPFSRQTHR